MFGIQTLSLFTIYISSYTYIYKTHQVTMLCRQSTELCYFNQTLDFMIVRRMY